MLLATSLAKVIASMKKHFIHTLSLIFFSPPYPIPFFFIFFSFKSSYLSNNFLKSLASSLFIYHHSSIFSYFSCVIKTPSYSLRKTKLYVYAAFHHHHLFTIHLYIGWIKIPLLHQCKQAHTDKRAFILLHPRGNNSYTQIYILLSSGSHTLTITINDSIADKAQISKQLMVVGLTVCQTLAFVVAVPHKRLLTLGTHKVLHVPMFPKSSDNSLFNGTPTRTADRDAHLVVASQAV